MESRTRLNNSHPLGSHPTAYSIYYFVCKIGIMILNYMCTRNNIIINTMQIDHNASRLFPVAIVSATTVARAVTSIMQFKINKLYFIQFVYAIARANNIYINIFNSTF